MYYEVCQVNWEFQGKRGLIYLGMQNKIKEGLLERAKECFPQYHNLEVIECEGEIRIEEPETLETF
jgi:hypothetical protein